MLGADQVTTQIEQIGNGSVNSHESLSLAGRLELSHPSLLHPGCLMGLFGPIILILFGAVNRLGDTLSMRHTIASQLISHDLSGLTSMTAQKSLEKALCSSTIALRLKKHIDNISVLIHGSPQVMQLAVDLYEDFINVESVAVTTVLSPQSSRI